VERLFEGGVWVLVHDDSVKGAEVTRWWQSVAVAGCSWPSRATMAGLAGLPRLQLWL